MQDIEPFYQWLSIYQASEDPRSPLFDRDYSETHYHHTVYNYFIHPQWDSIGSETLYLKILFVDYEEHYAIIEFIGEWNDTLHNDIMTLKREIIDVLNAEGIRKYILIGEHVFNFHFSDDCYYEEWFDEIAPEGWICLINFQNHVLQELQQCGLDQYLICAAPFDRFNWRRFSPGQTFGNISATLQKRLA